MYTTLSFLMAIRRCVVHVLADIFINNNGFFDLCMSFRYWPSYLRLFLTFTATNLFFLSKRPAQIPILPISPVFLFIYHHFAAGLVDCSRRKTTKSSSFLVSYYIVLNGDFFYSNIILQCFHITSWQQPYIDACTLALLFLACFVSSLLPCWFQVPFTFSLPIPTILSTPYLFFFLFLSTLTYTTWIPMCDPLIPHLTFVLFLLFFCRARSIS